jgi:hypothetical protein
MERDLTPPPKEENIRKMATILGQDPDNVLALAGKVSSDMFAIIKNNPSIAQFLRAHPNVTGEQLEAISHKDSKST